MVISLVSFSIEANICLLENNITTPQQSITVKKCLSQYIYKENEYFQKIHEYEKKVILLKEKLNKASIVCSKYELLYARTKENIFKTMAYDCKRLYKNRLDNYLKIIEQWSKMKRDYTLLIKNEMKILGLDNK